MKRMKKAVCLLLVLVITILCSSCGDTNTDVEAGFQFEMPKSGEKIAVLTIKNYGTIKMRLFPDQAPKAVENFIGLIENKYYNGLMFHRVINDFIIQAGDPTGTGTGGNSLWNEPFETETNESLRHFRGALAMSNSGENKNTSQFYIVQAGTNNITDDAFAAYKKRYGDDKYPDDIVNMYKEKGGTPPLDFSYTVFGQVFEGMEVVDAIAAEKTNEAARPIKNVVIEKAEIVKY